MIPTGRQIRDGRLLVGMSETDLAEAAGVKVELLVRVESADGVPMVKKVDSAAIQRALTIAGVEFVDGDSVKSRRSAST